MHSNVLRSRALRLKWHVAALRFEIAMLRHAQLLRKAGFRPDQARDEQGRWVAGNLSAENDPRIVSDADDDLPQVGDDFAQNRTGRGPASIRIGGRVVEVEPGQAARLFEAQSRAEDATERVRELDANWRPTPSAYESVEGLIRAYDAQAREAQGRASELAEMGIGPGPFSGESIPARGPERNFTVTERNEMNRIGSETGCHTCGTMEPGTKRDNYVPDHQSPSALNAAGRPQRLYPQCLSCSYKQGGYVSGLKKGR